MISIVTVAYRNGRDVRLLGESILGAHDSKQAEWIITNNDPADRLDIPPGLVERTRILTRRNVGYARGVNAAARWARGDALFVANPDLRLSPDVLTRAEEILRAEPDVAVLLPRLTYAGGATQPSIRRFYSWAAALYARCPGRETRPPPRFFRDYLMLDDDLSRPTEVDWGLGGAMFLRRADFPDGRIFDPRYFLYFEDVDLCLRVWRAGRRVVFRPDLICQHEHRRGSRDVFSTHGRHHLVSLLRFMLKHGGFPRRPPARARR